MLRNELGLKGTKEGCGEGECGACSVILNGELVNSCLILVGQLRRSDSIITIEGVGRSALGRRLQRSFVDNGAVQCGFCIPGMIMASFALLKKNRRPDREEILEGLAGNLCRCTGYKKIVEAVLACRSP